MLADDSHYVEAPVDWWVVITDVRGSTQAIQEGRYKTVNMVGAATLAAIFNAAGTRNIPFVFGGDGASALIPPDKVEAASAALRVSRKMARDEHGLDMRIGLVPHAKLVAEGAPIRVAKFRLSAGNAIAFFRGRGLGLAEAWVKTGTFLLDESGAASSLDPHAGLSCRWAPIKSRNGEILSLLIKFHDDTHLLACIGELSKLLGLHGERANPVRPEGLRAENIIKSARLEASLNGGGLGAVIQHALFLIFVILLDRGILPRRIFDMSKYKAEVSANSDFRKFDELLRVVADISALDRKRLIAKLDEWSSAGWISYGAHSSPEALMTCFVEDTMDDRHIHFIDGGDGGYAMAAKALKSRLASR